MEISFCEQKSEEWHDLRSERMTGSKGYVIHSAGEGLKTYILEKFQKKYSSKIEETEQFTNEHMERGNRLEDTAIFLYEQETGIKVERVGFVIIDNFLGVSPDGITPTEKGIYLIPKTEIYSCNIKGIQEVKCPDDKKFFRILINGFDPKKFKDDYYQMQMNMYCTKANWCDFIALNENFKTKLYVERIYPDEEAFKKIEKGIKQGKELIKNIKDKYSSFKEIIIKK